ncbi:MAG: conjugal transfer protein TrbF, partial [Parvibaculum sp.]|uniref:VirB8/TrbF family protein n=1 Tax=Parvibaculum sp. TaxID=2024848 RepID=UPI001B09E3F9
RAATTLNEYASANDPFADVGRKSRTVDVVSVVRVSEDSFQARWLEKTYENGALTGVKRFTGLFTIVYSPPRDAETLRANPLGLYIHSLNWGEDLVTGDNQ